MYKCSECGKLFNQKPDYCDCGNDTFIHIADTNSPKNAINAANSYQNQNRRYSYNNSRTYNTTQQSSRRFDNKSIIIFLICILFSIFFLFFVNTGNKEQTQNTKIVNKPKVLHTKIPTIDEIWIEREIPETDVSKEEKPIVTKVIDTYNNVRNQIAAPAKKTAPVYNYITPTYTAKKTVSAPQKKKTSQVQAKKTVPIPKATTKPVKQNTTPKKTQTATQNTKQQQTKTTTTPKPVSRPAVNTAAMQQEYTNYKIGLRNKIASNINFTAIVGDGSCVVSFKLDSSGNLINRAFSQQSINDSLNDAVYSAMMNTPTYKTPPAAYKNQTLKLSVKMSGGNFEVKLY